MSAQKWFLPDNWAGALWFDGTDLQVEGEFRWSTTGELMTSYINWNPDEPNDYEGDQDCTRLYDHNGRWDDFECYLELLSICEIEGMLIAQTKKAKAAGGHHC